MLLYIKIRTILKGNIKNSIFRNCTYCPWPMTEQVGRLNHPRILDKDSFLSNNSVASFTLTRSLETPRRAYLPQSRGVSLFQYTTVNTAQTKRTNEHLRSLLFLTSVSVANHMTPSLGGLESLFMPCWSFSF